MSLPAGLLLDPDATAGPLMPVPRVRRDAVPELPPAWVAALLCLVGGPAPLSCRALSGLRHAGLVRQVGAVSSPRGRRPLWALTEKGEAVVWGRGA